MKKFFAYSLLCLALGTTQVRAQNNTNNLTNADFWKEHPTKNIVEVELKKGINIGDLPAGQDPIALAMSNDADIEIIKYLIDQPSVNLKKTLHEGRIYLHSAAFDGNTAVADYLLSKGADMYFLDANGHTALTFAAVQGKLTPAMVDVFIKHGVDIKRKYDSKDGANLLLLAVPYDHDLKITDYLLAKGLSLQDTDKEGNTAFYHAAKIGDVSLMKALVQRNVKYDERALWAACQGTYRTTNKIDVYQYLVDDPKINPLIINDKGQNVLHLVTKKQAQSDVVTYFLSKGVDGGLVDDEGNTPFINACASKSLEAVTSLYPKIKNINAANKAGETALQLAVKGATGEIVAFLIEKGADVQVKDAEGNDLGYYLVQSYRPAGGRGGRGGAGAGGFGGENAPQKDDFKTKLQALQQKGLDVRKPQPDGSTLYHLAAAKGDVTLLKKLEGLGIDVNAKNGEGLTALHKAAMAAKDDSALKYLVSLGTQKNIATEFGETAYDLAKENETLAANQVNVDFLK